MLSLFSEEVDLFLLNQVRKIKVATTAAVMNNNSRFDMEEGI